MSHGFRGTSIGPARTFVDFEKVLLQEGFSVLRFDQPCGGNSEGEYIDSSFKEWIHTTAYFAHKYLDLGYQVALLGQSMGATTSMVVAAQTDLKDKIPCLLLWVPDAKSNVNLDPEVIDEEGGQRFKNRFWTEARDADFFEALDSYSGGIHLVYGETDRYVSQDLKNKTVEKIKSKNQPYMILTGQDHSSWDYDAAQKVYSEEIEFLRKYFKE
jgi:esterase/lipase